MSEPIMQIKNLKTYFSLGKKNGEERFVKAVDNVTMDIQEGEILGLVGESGSGKSTIAYSIIGMYKPYDGQILFRGKDLYAEPKRSLELKKDIQIVFQDPGSSLNPRHTVRELLELPLKVHGIGENAAQRMSRIKELLDIVELPSNYMYKNPDAMSGGERQMIAIARALATDPRMIILDEPTSALDVSIQAKIINMLIRLQKEKNMTYLFITHDLSLMRNIASRVAILYLGKVAEVSSAETFFTDPQHPYTQMLLSAIPVISEEDEAIKVKKVDVIGEIPSPVDVPPGCNFHMRCHDCMDICKHIDPEMSEPKPGHIVRCHLFDRAE